MKTSGYGVTDVGLCRDNNEDSLLVDEEIGLYIVCDGMGGHHAGEVASLEAAQGLREYISDRVADVDAMRDRDDYSGIQDLVVEAVKHTSRHVQEQAEKTGHTGMGTTLTLLLAVGTRAIIASVGDSRAYHCREKFVKLLTHDHTVAYELVRAGQLTVEEVRDHPFGHYLTRSIGHQEDVEVDTLVAHLVAGDLFVLCTDGLSRYFDDEAELGDYMFTKPAHIATELVEVAKSRGGRDNITALVVHVLKEPPGTRPHHPLRKWLTRVAVI